MVKGMEMHFVKGRESNFVLERQKERKSIEQNLKVKIKLQKVCGKGTLRKEYCSWSGLAKIKIKFG